MPPYTTVWPRIPNMVAKVVLIPREVTLWKSILKSLVIEEASYSCRNETRPTQELTNHQMGNTLNLEPHIRATEGRPRSMPPPLLRS